MAYPTYPYPGYQPNPYSPRPIPDQDAVPDKLAAYYTYVVKH